MQTKYIGLTIPDALFVMFIGLKLAGVISWSWWFVFAPFYLPYMLSYVLNTVKKYNEKTALIKKMQG